MSSILGFRRGFFSQQKSLSNEELNQKYKRKVLTEIYKYLSKDTLTCPLVTVLKSPSLLNCNLITYPSDEDKDKVSQILKINSSFSKLDISRRKKCSARDQLKEWGYQSLRDANEIAEKILNNNGNSKSSDDTKSSVKPEIFTSQEREFVDVSDVIPTSRYVWSVIRTSHHDEEYDSFCKMLIPESAYHILTQPANYYDVLGAPANGMFTDEPSEDIGFYETADYDIRPRGLVRRQQIPTEGPYMFMLQPVYI